MDDVNPNGGGISLGHPLGATGARITATLVNELERRERALRHRDDVHRLRPGDRGGDRARSDALAAHPRPRRPAARAGGATEAEIRRHVVVASRPSARAGRAARSSTQRSGRRSSASSRWPAIPEHDPERDALGVARSRSGRSRSWRTSTTRRRSRPRGVFPHESSGVHSHIRLERAAVRRASTPADRGRCMIGAWRSSASAR